MNMAIVLGFIEALRQEIQLIFRAYLLMIRYNMACYSTNIYAQIQV
jgi:hypothetical protein